MKEKMKKLIKLYLLPLIIIILFVTPVLGHFPEAHIQIVETALNDPTWNSELKQKVLKHPNECLAGMMGIDSTVIFYLTEEGRNKIYGGTHSIKWLDDCNKLYKGEAQEVFCRCGGLHLAIDPTSHGYKEYEGYTSKCIGKYLSTNIFLHSICERSVVNNLMENLDKFPYSPSKDKIRLDTCDSYDLMIKGDEEVDTSKESCTNEYVKLLSASSGVDLCQAVRIVGSNLKLMCTENQELGSGYTDIYRSKIEAPTSWKWTALIGFIILLMLLLANIIIGRTWWKILVVIFILPLLFISGLGVYYGFFNVEGFYHDYNFIILDPLTKFINVPKWEDEIRKSIEDTKSYFSDPEYDIPKSASGLDHYEEGKLIKGTLNRAETFGRTVWWLFVTLYILLFIFLEYKTFRKKTEKNI